MKKLKTFKFAIKNFGIVTKKRFSSRKEAITFAKRNISNHPKLNWWDIYEIVEIPDDGSESQ